MTRFILGLCAFGFSAAIHAAEVPVEKEFQRNAWIAGHINSWSAEKHKNFLKSLKNKKDKAYWGSLTANKSFSNIKAEAVLDWLVIREGQNIVTIKKVSDKPLKLQINDEVFGPIDLNNIQDSFSKANKKKSALMELVLPSAHAFQFRRATAEEKAAAAKKWGFMYSIHASMHDSCVESNDMSGRYQKRKEFERKYPDEQSRPGPGQPGYVRDFDYEDDGWLRSMCGYKYQSRGEFGLATDKVIADFNMTKMNCPEGNKFSIGTTDGQSTEMECYGTGCRLANQFGENQIKNGQQVRMMSEVLSAIHVCCKRERCRNKFNEVSEVELSPNEVSP